MEGKVHEGRVDVQGTQGSADTLCLRTERSRACLSFVKGWFLKKGLGCPVLCVLQEGKGERTEGAEEAE